MTDGQTVETVAIPARDRLTLCVSSQVGCAVGCTFCHTATQGLKRHLKASEVVLQYVTIQKWLMDNVHAEEKLTNITGLRRAPVRAAGARRRPHRPRDDPHPPAARRRPRHRRLHGVHGHPAAQGRRRGRRRVRRRRETGRFIVFKAPA